MANVNNNNTSLEFFNLLRALNLTCKNVSPTRVDSCIDNKLVIFSYSLCEIKLLPGCLADPEPLFLKFKLINSKTDSKLSQKFFCKQTEETILAFLYVLSEEKWEILTEYELGHVDLETLCNGFFKKIVDLWHYSSPIIIKSVGL